MDIHYVNGVKNEHGETVMRSLTEEEKDWLDQFYKEELSGTRKGAVFNDSFKKIDDANNARNRCIMNLARMTNKLESFDAKSYDNVYIEYTADQDHELTFLDKNKTK
jgi:hypothetical protein